MSQRRMPKLDSNCGAYVKKKAAADYSAGKLTISKAAEKAAVTVWEMQQYLISKGFRSQYSTEDLKDEMNKIKAK